MRICIHSVGKRGKQDVGSVILTSTALYLNIYTNILKQKL